MSDTGSHVSVSQEARTQAIPRGGRCQYHCVIDEIAKMQWHNVDESELKDVAWVYYYFSIQFRESLEIACARHPDDPLLRELDRGERNTDNLSPWAGVARPGELLNHDEFMRRTLQLSAVDEQRRLRLDSIGMAYLGKVRALDHHVRIKGLASYEDGGLEMVFRSILRARDWRGSLLQAFRHFLLRHIEFDSDPEHGHGAVCRHLAPDDSVLPLWSAFRDSLVTAAPTLVPAD